MKCGRQIDEMRSSSIAMSTLQDSKEERDKSKQESEESETKLFRVVSEKDINLLKKEIEQKDMDSLKSGSPVARSNATRPNAAQLQNEQILSDQDHSVQEVIKRRLDLQEEIESIVCKDKDTKGKDKPEQVSDDLDESVRSPIIGGVPFHSVEEESPSEIGEDDIDIPPRLRLPQYDLVLLYSEVDETDALNFKALLEKFIVLSDGKPPRVCAKGCADELNSIVTDHIAYMGLAQERSTMVFFYMSKDFCKDSWMEIQKNEAILNAIEDPEKKWSIVPLNKPPKERNYRPPFGIGPLKGVAMDRIFKDRNLRIEHVSDIDSLTKSEIDKYFIENTTKMLNERRYLLKKREEEDKKKIEEYKVEERHKRLMAKHKEQHEQKMAQKLSEAEVKQLHEAQLQDSIAVKNKLRHLPRPQINTPQGWQQQQQSPAAQAPTHQQAPQPHIPQMPAAFPQPVLLGYDPYGRPQWWNPYSLPQSQGPVNITNISQYVSPGATPSPLQKNVTVVGSTGVAVGDHNTQDIGGQQAAEEDEGSDEEIVYVHGPSTSTDPELAPAGPAGPPSYPPPSYRHVVQQGAGQATNPGPSDAGVSGSSAGAGDSESARISSSACGVGPLSLSSTVEVDRAVTLPTSPNSQRSGDKSGSETSYKGPLPHAGYSTILPPSISGPPAMPRQQLSSMQGSNNMGLQTMHSNPMHLQTPQPSASHVTATGPPPFHQTFAYPGSQAMMPGMQYASHPPSAMYWPAQHGMAMPGAFANQPPPAFPGGQGVSLQATSMYGPPSAPGAPAPSMDGPAAMAYTPRQ